MRQSTGGNWFKHDCEEKAAAKRWHMTDDTDWYHQATKRPVPKYDECQKGFGVYVLAGN
jgi:hypothetical protein